MSLDGVPGDRVSNVVADGVCKFFSPLVDSELVSSENEQYFSCAAALINGCAGGLHLERDNEREGAQYVATFV